MPEFGIPNETTTRVEFHDEGDRTRVTITSGPFSPHARAGRGQLDCPAREAGGGPVLVAGGFVQLERSKGVQLAERALDPHPAPRYTYSSAAPLAVWVNARSREGGSQCPSRPRRPRPSPTTSRWLRVGPSPLVPSTAPTSVPSKEATSRSTRS